MPKFSSAYRETCFLLWYNNGAPNSLQKAVDLMNPDANGEKPSVSTMRQWMSEDWRIRADAMDAEANELAERNMIEQKAQMLRDQAECDKTLQIKGLDYLNEHGFDSSSSAVSAVIQGAKLEQESRGIGDLIVKMSKMSDVDLKREIIKRLEALQGDRDNTVEGVVGEETDQEPDTSTEDSSPA